LLGTAEVGDGFIHATNKWASPMTKEDEYRQAAMTSLKLAETGSPGEKVRMLLLAQAWFKLAERRAQSTQEYPLPLGST